ncbi:D-glycero-beta-D-manno-heptose 1-phosphate adenylyltransferase [Rhizobium sp. FY34]|uniref:D-glycero-beta-D-manno-heptose 1-phosphate adenylyltransferase n=1 Tax=Rhizobium sp. FY34 TaxID=2562309 RepID=UPI0010C119BF|nr:D-glycero-beta-D-manno-heptose 1-phosphate adenylyltransferase [Rhizobium sp. FY34]
MLTAAAPDLATRVKALTYSRVLCVGDVMMDRYVEGHVSRISPESAAPVFIYRAEHVLPGGAANVARNISALGGQCTLIGVIGDDVAATTLVDCISKYGDVNSVMVVSDDRPTTVKTRYEVRGHHLLRVDHEATFPVPKACEDACIAAIVEHLPAHDVVVLSDYDKGVLTERLLGEVMKRAQALNKPVIVDPKSSNLGKYAGASIMTPNANETRQACGIYPDTDEKAEAAATLYMDASQAQAVLITRGEQGMTLVSRGKPAVHICSQVSEVFDVVGAGDTVVATLGAAIACGHDIGTAAQFANAAAGIVVGKRGTATTSPDELMLALENQGEHPSRKGTPIMLKREEAARYARIRRMEGKIVGFTNGCFDILHPGHISLLKFARAHCDCLIVGLNSDASVTRLKGPSRPINVESDRSIVLSALGTVDAVVIFEEETPLDLVKAVMPDILIKGADYTIETVVGADVVLANGGKVLLAPLVPGKNSTTTIERLKLAQSDA